MSQPRILVIGGGPGGYTAAFYAADKGSRVTLINDEDRLGGVCLQRGCIPSKALLHVAKLIHETREARQWGLDFGDPDVNLDVLRGWKNQVVRKMTGGLAQLRKQRDVQFVSGRAKFLNSNSVAVDGQGTFEFDRAILATGSSPVRPPFWNLESSRVMDSTAALELDDIPQRLLVVGGGYIGLELGTVYAALGSRVSVVEMTDGLLPGVDRDLVRILQIRLRKEFEALYLNTTLSALRESGDAIEVTLEGQAEPETQTFDRVLVSVGRRPNSNNLGLENTQVRRDSKGFINTHAGLRTDDPNIWAIGDVIGGAMLAHKASHEGRAAVDSILGAEMTFEPVIPAVVFTDPEIAWCGLTETEAREQGIAVKVGKFPWGASGRAQTLGRTDGQTKLLVDPETQKVLGVGLVGPGAGELIAEGVLAVETGLTAAQLASSIHPHPTLSETIMEASEVILGTPTHIMMRDQ